MRISIDHWHRRYRVRDQQVRGWESLAENAVLQAFEQSLAEMASDEREVIVLRQVSLRFTTEEPEQSHQVLAQQWGEAMAAAVRDSIARNDPENVRRFTDVDEHLVCYLQALMTEQDSDAWYFDRLRDKEINATRTQIERLLEKNLDRWPELLGRLVEKSLVHQTLRNVSQSMRRRLWSEGIRGFKTLTDPEAERPIFRSALLIVSQLTNRQFSSQESHEAFRDYVARPLPPTDWNDMTHLAEATFSAVRFLSQRFSVMFQSAGDSTDAVSNRIDNAVHEFDWLDRSWLKRRLIDHCFPTSKTSQVSRRITINVAAWEQKWRDVQERFFREWDRSDPVSGANCLLALSLIIERNIDQVHDPALHSFVERKLIELSNDRSRVRPEPAPTDNDKRSSDTVHGAANARAAAASRTDLFRIEEDQISSISEEFEETSFAGVFLLVRGIHDLRLGSLGRKAAFANDDHGVAGLFVDLARYWMDSSASGRFDRGLLEVARLAGPIEWDDLIRPKTSSNDTDRRLQSLLARTLIELGSWTDPPVLHLTIEQITGQQYLRGGDGQSRIYPWCAPLDDSTSASLIAEAWREEMVGWSRHPISVQIDQSASSCLMLRDNNDAQSSLATKGTVNGEHNALHHATIHATAHCVLRHWARSLRGLRESSDGFLLRQLIQRSGRIVVETGKIEIHLDSRPLDAALQVSGLLDPLDFYCGKKLLKLSFHTGH